MSKNDWQSICKSYIGHTQTHTETLLPTGVNALLSTLNDSSTLSIGDPVPALFHWLYFNQLAPAHQLKSDGHEKLGNFLPPVPYPRRMWAGSTLQFHSTLRLGESTTQSSSIKSVDFKTGASGKLCFVNVEHCYSQQNQNCLTDVHTIVYKEDSGKVPASDQVTTRQKAADACTQSLNSIVLFRYSALTLNSHRIHYDKDYCRDVEGYPDLVVHGPLMATLLVRKIQSVNPDRQLSTFSFRALAPVFVEETFKLETECESETATAYLVKSDGVQAMRARASWVS